MALGSLLWLALMLLYVCKWLLARPAAILELRDPIQGAYVSLMPVTTMLVALAAAPYERSIALVLFFLGTAGQLLVGINFISGLWRGGRDRASLTPALYLPGVASNFVTAIVAGPLGYANAGALFFGVGVLYWIATESVMLYAIATEGPLAPARRPMLGIQLAPPAVGCVAYLSITSGPPELFAYMLYGYAAFYALVLARLLPWMYRPAGFSAGFWSFSFGGTAIATAGLRLVDRGTDGPVSWLVLPVFICSNVLIVGLCVGTIALLLRGRFFSNSSAAEPVSTRITSAPSRKGAVATRASYCPFSALKPRSLLDKANPRAQPIAKPIPQSPIAQRNNL
jgi:tellurite resistance protein